MSEERSLSFIKIRMDRQAGSSRELILQYLVFSDTIVTEEHYIRATVSHHNDPSGQVILPKESVLSIHPSCLED